MTSIWTPKKRGQLVAHHFYVAFEFDYTYGGGDKKVKQYRLITLPDDNPGKAIRIATRQIASGFKVTESALRLIEIKRI